MKSEVKRLLAAIPIVCFMVMMNVFIATSVAGVVMIQLLAYGVNSMLSLWISILLAILINAYIVCYGYLRKYLKD